MSISERIRHGIEATPWVCVEVGKLEASYGGLKADAERYRALRRGQKWSVIDGIGDALRGDELDAAIDAAMVPNVELRGATDD